MPAKLSYWLIGYALFMLMLGTNLPSPLYRLYEQRLGFSPFVLTAIFATYALVLLASLPVFGKLSDRLGRKLLLGIGMLVSLLGSAAFAWADSTPMLFAARALQGLSVGLLSGAATAALQELNPYAEAKTPARTATIATAAGTALGPLLGGVIARYAASPLVTPYVWHIALELPCIALVWLIRETVPSTRGRRPTGNVPPEAGGEASSSMVKRVFRITASASFLAWSVTALFLAVIPSYASNLLHIRSVAFGGGVVFLMLAASVAAQLVLRTLHPTASMAIGLALLLAGLIGIVVAVPLQSVGWLLAGTVVAGVGQGASFKGSMEAATLIAPAGQRGALISKLYMVIYAGVGLPIVAVGSCASAFGLYHTVCGFTVCLVLLTGFVLVGLWKSMKREVLRV